MGKAYEFMQIEYKSETLKETCTDIRKATKKYNKTVAEKLISTINFIEASESLIDVRNYPPFKFHLLIGDKKGFYAIDLGRKLGYRILVKPLLNGQEAISTDIFSNKAIEIKIIKVEEVTNHYA